MITTDMRKYAPQTVEEMIHANYTLYILPDAEDLTKPSQYVIPWLKNYEAWEFKVKIQPVRCEIPLIH